MAEAFGIACHELVSLDFRCGSQAVIFNLARNVRSCEGLSDDVRQASGEETAGRFCSVVPAVRSMGN
jgi:hypothetical protein